LALNKIDVLQKRLYGHGGAREAGYLHGNGPSRARYGVRYRAPGHGYDGYWGEMEQKSRLGIQECSVSPRFSALRHRSQGRALCRGSRKAFVLENDSAPGSPQGCKLQSRVLVVGRYAGIAVIHGSILRLTFETCKSAIYAGLRDVPKLTLYETPAFVDGASSRPADDPIIPFRVQWVSQVSG
jgi:hypothetical protein